MIFPELFAWLQDAISFLWSGRWPTVQGEITAVDVERIRYSDGNKLRLALAFKFSIGDDGPYTGEAFWQPKFSPIRRVTAARRKFRIRQSVIVRYRPDDPSVNTLDRDVWQGL